MQIPAKYRIATAEQSQQIDAQTINEFGMEGFTLMEVAGLSAATHLLDQIDPGSHGVILCGKGNNGGDALVTARYLAQQQISVTVVFIAGTDDLSQSAQKNYSLLQKIATNDEHASINFVKTWSDLDKNQPIDFIVDGMLGTGLDSDLRGSFTDAVRWVNNQSAAVYAMDIPTGIRADTGNVMGDAIEAHCTFAFGILKQGYYLNEGKKCTGAVKYCKLPFPDYFSNHCKTTLIDRGWVKSPQKERARHKYEAGVVHIIAGSEGLTGAAIMAAESAWAEGVGAVVLICPRGTLQVFENNLPQVIKKPVGSKDDLCFKDEHCSDVHSIVEEKDGPVLIGPGLGRNSSTVQFIHSFLEKAQRDIIIDADALWALAQKKDWSPNQSNWTLTPHPGELSNLTGQKITDDFDRLQTVRELAQQKGITLLSKGFPVILGTSDGNCYVTAYDTRIFSRAGFGDILAGKIAAFNALETESRANCIHALLNGKAKAEYAQEHNEHPLEPFDLV